ncbi:MAG: YeeE/YedE family protein [Rhizobiales bacterium]|nr:YeeE/YedE family protein [Hyphomicrobiales bacterium]
MANFAHIQDYNVKGAPHPPGALPLLPRKQGLVIAIGLLCLAYLAFLAFQNGPVNHVGAVMVGGFAGFALYHASFGFTAAWRRMVVERRGNGLRAQMMLVALTCSMSFLLLDYGRFVSLPWFGGQTWSLETHGFVNPWGMGSAIGAFMFGFGMMFGGGCASGTLFTSGGGSSRMMITLFFFIIGSVLGTHDIDFWQGLPHFAPFSFVEIFGAPGALAIFLPVLAAIYFGSILIEKRQWGAIEGLGRTESLLTGIWSKRLGALALVVVSIGTLIVLHRPWGITSGFAFWGAKMFDSVGIPVASWPAWSAEALSRSVFADATSLMNFGIILGAMIAAGLAGKWKPALRISARDLFTAILGGLLMGYGARLSYGCNIGAYLGGLVSGSMHGWWWLIFGFVGSVLGIRTKARFNL